MKRKQFLCLLMIPLCLVLTSCKRQSTMDASEKIRGLYAEMQSCSLQTVLKADFGDRVNEFTLQYDFSREGRSAVEILAPEEVRGVRATIEAGQTELSFDGVILETGPLPGTGLTPVDALPVMLKAWGEGYVSSVGHEKIDGVECVLIVCKSTVSGVETEYRSWFDAEDYKPVKAEVMADGVRVIECEFEKFSFGE